MALDFPGYRPAIAGQVYTREKTVINGTDSLVLAQILIPKKFTEPSEDQVTDYLREKASSLSAPRLLLPNRLAAEGKSDLERAISHLPDSVIRDIQKGDPQCEEFIRAHTSAPRIKEGHPNPQYIHCKYGLIPQKIIEANKGKENTSNPDWYNNVLSHEHLRRGGLGERWNFKLLLYDGLLPEREELDILIKHGTHGSKTFDLSRIYYDPEEVTDVLDALYGGLSTPEQISQLTDISDKTLEGFTIQPVIALLKQVQAASRQQQGADQLMVSLGGLKGKIPSN